MSEDFDREAEKERLREKLEADEESRKSTEHMSELLLKGATMTNRHCDTCGDPIFRYDGQAFCPTCEETVDTGGGQGDAGAEGAAEGEQGADAAEAGAAETAQGVEAGGAREAGSVGDATGQNQSGATQGHAETGQPRNVDAGGADATGTTEQATAANTGPARAGPAAQSSGTGQPAPGSAADRAPGAVDGAGGIAEARASLVRTLSDLAARAEGAEDVRRRRDLLSAAREAAEAIAALDRTDL